MSVMSLEILAAAAAAVQEKDRLENERQLESPDHQSTERPGPQGPYFYRKGQYQELEALASVERSAAEKYRLFGQGHLIDGSTMPYDRLKAMFKEGHVWVALDIYGPIGYVCGENIDGSFHVAEISVAYEFQGVGIGKKLMNTMIEDVIKERFRSITLTTFRDIFWNAPWYTKFGFYEVNPKLVGGSFENLLEEEEINLRLDRRFRLLMMKPLHTQGYF